jgi:hypothetical protein
VKGDPLNPRAQELLAERALRPLDDKEHWELQQLGVSDDDSFDLAAAAVVVATTVMEPMPAALMEQILAKAPGAGTLDWKRTLPGVSMPSPADLPRDTLVGVELSELAPKDQPTTEPLIAQKEIAATKLMGVPSAALETLPPPMVKRPPAIQAPSLVEPPDKPVSNEPQVRFAKEPAIARTPTPVTPMPSLRTPASGVAIDVPRTPVPPADVPVAGRTPTPIQVPATSRTPTPMQVPATSRTPTPMDVPVVGRAPTPMQPIAPLPPVLPANVPPPGEVVRMPLPQDSQPFSVDTPVPAVPISRDRSTPLPVLPPEVVTMPSRDEIAQRRAAERRDAKTVPLKPVSRSVMPWLAAAACLLVAGGAVWWAYTQKPEPATVPTVATSPATDRAALLASATDIAKITWTITQDPTSRSATGDVVWSPSAQRGYMRFVGLTPNDPTQFQYQLWIFDKTRDQAFPVDGGVFDVNSNGEVVVAINPKLHVNDLGMFAVTVEKPGGVVVSKRERIVVTATRT